MKPYDVEKTRRVCRDLLNKTQKPEDILKVAKILGAKIYLTPPTSPTQEARKEKTK